MKRLTFLLFIAVAAKADVMYTWTIFGSGSQSISYSFSLPTFPTDAITESGSLAIEGYLGAFSNYSCNQLSAEDCAWSVNFTSAPNSITDLGSNFGQAALYLCWDAGSSGCDTGVNASEGALIPGLNIDQLGTYWGTIIGTNNITEVTITDPPSVPEPGPARLFLAAAGFYVLYVIARSRRRIRR